MDKTTLTFRTTEEVKRIIKMNALLSKMTVKDYLTKLALTDNERLEKKYDKKMD